MSFLNKVALVTGASSGIGAAIALKFSAEGAKVAIIGRNEIKLKDVSKRCEQNGSKPLTIIADVTKDDNAKRIVSDTLKQFGKLDILINNAGIGTTTSILAPNALEVFDQVLSTNLRSVVNITHLAGPYLIESKGNIINISSNASMASFGATGFSYNASKAGLDHFTRTVALELAAKGVRVNTVNPGPVKTDIGKNIGLTEEQEAKHYEMFRRGTALGKISEADEIAEVVLFLAGNKARSVTGASFVIDNGTLIRR